MRLAVLYGRMLFRRRRRPGECRRWVELGCVLIEILELFAGVVIECVLSNKCVSHVNQHREALVMWAAEGEGRDRSRKSGFEKEPHHV